MATRSAAKAHRQSLNRHLRNRAERSATKTATKRAAASIASGDLEAARAEVRAAISALDRAAHKRVLHPNAAARHKSGLLLKYNAAVAAQQTPAAEPRRGRGKTAEGRSSRKAGGTSSRKQAKK